jgi:GT2 family glycosyltransferase
MKFVAIIILNWNAWQDTLECLRSVYAQDYSNYRVLVVDNGSTNDSVEQIRGAFPQVEILETGENLGYAGGNNAGIRHVMDWGMDFVLILNNDTLVAEDMLSMLVKRAESSGMIGMVGPRMLCYGERRNLLFAAGSFVDWEKATLVHRGIFQPAIDHLYEAGPVDFVVGCGVLVRTSLLQKMGGFYEPYYLNFEDVEWGIRARKIGYQVWYEPKALLWHKVSASLGLASPANTYYMTRNSLLFFSRFGSLGQRWMTIAKIILRTVRTMAVWKLKPKYRESEAYKKKWKANYFALRDFLRGRFGAMESDVREICYEK